MPRAWPDRDHALRLQLHLSQAPTFGTVPTHRASKTHVNTLMAGTSRHASTVLKTIQANKAMAAITIREPTITTIPVPPSITRAIPIGSTTAPMIWRAAWMVASGPVPAACTIRQ
jgi:hypothetical protein